MKLQRPEGETRQAGSQTAPSHSLQCVKACPSLQFLDQVPLALLRHSARKKACDCNVFNGMQRSSSSSSGRSGSSSRSRSSSRKKGGGEGAGGVVGVEDRRKRRRRGVGALVVILDVVVVVESCRGVHTAVAVVVAIVTKKQRTR